MTTADEAARYSDARDTEEAVDGFPWPAFVVPPLGIIDEPPPPVDTTHVKTAALVTAAAASRAVSPGWAAHLKLAAIWTQEVIDVGMVDAEIVGEPELGRQGTGRSTRSRGT